MAAAWWQAVPAPCIDGRRVPEVHRLLRWRRKNPRREAVLQLHQSLRPRVSALLSHSSIASRASLRMYADSLQVYSRDNVALGQSYPITLCCDRQRATAAHREPVPQDPPLAQYSGTTFGDARTLYAFGPASRGPRPRTSTPVPAPLSHQQAAPRMPQGRRVGPRPGAGRQSTRSPAMAGGVHGGSGRRARRSRVLEARGRRRRPRRRSAPDQALVPELYVLTSEPAVPRSGRYAPCRAPGSRRPLLAAEDGVGVVLGEVYKEERSRPGPARPDRAL